MNIQKGYIEKLWNLHNSLDGFNCSLRVALQSAGFWTDTTIPMGWFHLVLNYLGPDRGQGIRIYMNGTEIASDDSPSTSTAYISTRGDERVVIGKYYTDRDIYYGDIDVDELLFFNDKLTEEQILAIKDMK